MLYIFPPKANNAPTLELSGLVLELFLFIYVYASFLLTKDSADLQKWKIQDFLYNSAN